MFYAKNAIHLKETFYGILSICWAFKGGLKSLDLDVIRAHAESTM